MLSEAKTSGVKLRADSPLTAVSLSLVYHGLHKLKLKKRRCAAETESPKGILETYLSKSKLTSGPGRNGSHI